MKTRSNTSWIAILVLVASVAPAAFAVDGGETLQADRPALVVANQPLVATTSAGDDSVLDSLLRFLVGVFSSTWDETDGEASGGDARPVDPLPRGPGFDPQGHEAV